MGIPSILALYGLPLVILCWATPCLAAPFQPPGLQAGDQYHLMFVTSDGRDAFSTEINDYNSFVTSQASLNPALTGTDVGLPWFAIASTAAVDARDNALVEAPVYLLNGEKIFDGFADIWDGSHIAVRPTVDQFGVDRLADPMWPGPLVWTGTDVDGTAMLPPLGGLGDNWMGNSGAFLSAFWLLAVHGDKIASRPLYALSQVIRVESSTPEPGTLLLFGVGVSSLIVARRRGIPRLDNRFDTRSCHHSGTRTQGESRSHP